MNGASLARGLSRSGAQNRCIGGAPNGIVQELLDQHAKKVHMLGSRAVGTKAPVGQVRIHLIDAQERLVKTDIPTICTTLFQSDALTSLPKVVVDVNLRRAIEVLCDDLWTGNSRTK